MKTLSEQIEERVAEKSDRPIIRAPFWVYQLAMATEALETIEKSEIKYFKENGHMTGTPIDPRVVAREALGKIKGESK